MKPALVKLPKDVPLNSSIELKGWKIESEVPGLVSPLPLKPITWNGKELPALKVVPLVEKSYLRFFVLYPVFGSYSKELKEEILQYVDNFHISTSDPLITEVSLKFKKENPMELVEKITNLLVFYYRTRINKEDEWDVMMEPTLFLSPVIEETQPSFEE